MSKNIKYTAAIIGTGRIGFSLGFDKKREQPAAIIILNIWLIGKKL